jgi:hypothetical protein
MPRFESGIAFGTCRDGGLLRIYVKSDSAFAIPSGGPVVSSCFWSFFTSS